MRLRIFTQFYISIKVIKTVESTWEIIKYYKERCYFIIIIRNIIILFFIILYIFARVTCIVRAFPSPNSCIKVRSLIIMQYIICFLIFPQPPEITQSVRTRRKSSKGSINHKGTETHTFHSVVVQRDAGFPFFRERKRRTAFSSSSQVGKSALRNSLESLAGISVTSHGSY